MRINSFLISQEKEELCNIYHYCVKLFHLIHLTFFSQIFLFVSIIVYNPPFIVIDEKLAELSTSNAVIVSQFEDTNSQSSYLEKKLESERLIHREVESRLREADFKAVRSEIDGLLFNFIFLFIFIFCSIVRLIFVITPWLG